MIYTLKYVQSQVYTYLWCIFLLLPDYHWIETFASYYKIYVESRSNYYDIKHFLTNVTKLRTRQEDDENVLVFSNNTYEYSFF